MNVLNWLNDFLIGAYVRISDAINPANGLPMIGGEGGVDVAGNPYGTDRSSMLDDHRGMSSNTLMDDDWGLRSDFSSQDMFHHDNFINHHSHFDHDSFSGGSGHDGF